MALGQTPLQRPVSGIPNGVPGAVVVVLVVVVVVVVGTTAVRRRREREENITDKGKGNRKALSCPGVWGFK